MEESIFLPPSAFRPPSLGRAAGIAAAVRGNQFVGPASGELAGLLRRAWDGSGAAARIDASATDDGDGGNVVVWSDNATEFHGNIIAQGGPTGGNGGFVETSGKLNLDMQGIVSADAPKGTAGTWLMDPADVTISGSDSGITSNPNFVPDDTQAEATINTSDIETTLNAGTNVTVTTGGDSESGTYNGQITVSSAITATGSGSLTLSAYPNIVINFTISLSGGNLLLDADNHANHSGYINVEGAITTGGGNITMGGGEANPNNIAAGTGYAYGNSSTTEGVFIDNTVNAGDGNSFCSEDTHSVTTDQCSHLFRRDSRYHAFHFKESSCPVMSTGCLMRTSWAAKGR